MDCLSLLLGFICAFRVVFGSGNGMDMGLDKGLRKKHGGRDGRRGH